MDSCNQSIKNSATQNSGDLGTELFLNKNKTDGSKTITTQTEMTSALLSTFNQLLLTADTIDKDFELLALKLNVNVYFHIINPIINHASTVTMLPVSSKSFPKI